MDTQYTNIFYKKFYVLFQFDLNNSGAVQNTTTDLLQQQQQSNDNKVTPPQGLSGLLNKAKSGLTASSNRPYEKTEVPKKEVKKSEVDMQWEEIEKGMIRDLKLRDIDFTDLTKADDLNLLDCQPIGGAKSQTSALYGNVPPPPPLNA